MISIKKHKKPILKNCEMRCDKPLHKKLDKFELTRFLNKHTTNLLIGRPGSGKTSLLFSLFENKEILRKVFHRIYVFQPVYIYIYMLNIYIKYERLKNVK